MMRYFATFISGTGDIIIKRLKQFNPSELKIIDLQDGLLLFDATLDDHKLAHLRFFNNVFMLLADLGVQPSLDAAMQKVPEVKGPTNISGTFRIVALDANRPSPLPDRPKARIVRVLGDSLGLKFDPTDARHDIVLLRRGDGQTLLGLRLEKPNFKKHPRAGAISIEMAHILCMVAGLGAKDIMLDPFAGFGSIPFEAVRDFNVKKAIAVERDGQLAGSISAKGLVRLEVMVGDATQLSEIPADSITRIVTDPPWGKFEHMSEIELDNLYQKSLSEMVRVVRTGGVIVILTAVEIQDYIKQLPLETVKQYNVLVAGQRATIYKLRVNK